MDDTHRVATAAFVTAMAGVGILGAKSIIQDSLADLRTVHKCACGCLMRDHDQQLKPGRTLEVLTGRCNKCQRCLKYREVPSK